MRLSLLLVLGSCLGGIRAGQAQTLGTSQAATAEQRLAEDLGVDRLRNALLPTPDTRNAAVLLQIGVGNKASIDQTSQGVLPNQATVVQVGTSNALTLTQTGLNNQTVFGQTGTANQATLRQEGSNNVLQGQVNGNENTLQVQQQGQSNTYTTQLTGSQGRYDIEQIGNNNSLTQRETTTATPLPGYEVKMQGSGIHLTIEQGKAFP